MKAADCEACAAIEENSHDKTRTACGHSADCPKCDCFCQPAPTSSSDGKLRGELPTPIATFHFDTSTED